MSAPVKRFLPKTASFSASLWLTALVLLAGCSGDRDDSRHDLSGRVTYAGKPVPAGRIVFSPDDAQGNQGPATIADIKDGRYRTRAGKGAVAGAYVVTVYGTNGMTATEARDNALFPPYRLQLTIDAENTSYDIVIPASAGGSSALGPT